MENLITIKLSIVLGFIIYVLFIPFIGPYLTVGILLILFFPVRNAFIENRWNRDNNISDIKLKNTKSKLKNTNSKVKKSLNEEGSIENNDEFNDVFNCSDEEAKDMRVYLQEIGRIKVLGIDEEIELAKKISDRIQLEELATEYKSEKGHFPSVTEWCELAEMPRSKLRKRLLLGRRAKEKMVQSNLRLVVSIAKEFMKRGLLFFDLIDEGILGLNRAAEKFDHEKGLRFSTFATWYIRQAITRAIADQSRTIKLPVNLYETISRIKRTTKVLRQEFGRKPSEEEIAESMGMTIEKLRLIAKTAQLPIPLETPIGKEEDSRLGDFIEADKENPEENPSELILRGELEEVLATLSPRERDVLRMRYGIDDGRRKSLEEIGKILKVKGERIRQIEAKALRNLRHPNRNQVLKKNFD